MTFARAAPAAVPARSAAEPLRPAVRERMGRRFGFDFSQVRIHASPADGDLAAAAGAHAFTVGRDVYLGRPASSAGDQLLSHELAHVVQQAYGSRLPEAQAESQADAMATGKVRLAPGGGPALERMQRQAAGSPPRPLRLIGTGFRQPTPARQRELDQLGLRLPVAPKLSAVRDDPQFVDNLVRSVAYGVMLGGYVLECEGLDRLVFVPERYVDYTFRPAPPAANVVHPSYDAAMAALAAPAFLADAAAQQSKEPTLDLSGPDPAYAYYQAPENLPLVVPTRFTRQSAPRTLEIMGGARVALSDFAVETLKAVQIQIAGSIVLRGVLPLAARFGRWLGGRGPAPGGASPARSGLGPPPSETSPLTPAAPPPPSARPRLTVEQIRAMRQSGVRVVTFRSFDRDVVANQVIRPTGRTNPAAPPHVYFGDGYEGFNYGDYYLIVERDQLPSLRPSEYSPGQWSTPDEIPTNVGGWATRADVSEALGKPSGPSSGRGQHH
ncbi:DUF4157 domain-containing protein [Actinoplanes sp. CA-030573]|uniref:DUF4157 domain-containing protein n=1 Tax=Actinoplanes sp. CA-030573 TaxID=3239898 RepID=UPI003D89DE97